jgi:hypothetical protein
MLVFIRAFLKFVHFLCMCVFFLKSAIMLEDGRALEESVTARIRAHLRQALHVDDHGILRATSNMSAAPSSFSSSAEVPGGSAGSELGAESSDTGPGPITRLISLQVSY